MTKKPAHRIIIRTDLLGKITTSDLPIQCIYSSLLIVPGHKVPSGIEYAFGIGEIKNVPAADREALLALTYLREACCGNPQPPGPGKYFTAS